MNYHPILFSAPMIRALLDETKTQTRRAAKVKNTLGHQSISGPRHGKYARAYLLDKEHDMRDIANACPYGLPGDQLWVRETWAYGIHALAAKDHERNGPWVYAADGDIALQHRLCERWRPSIHMFQAASRITLEITGVRVEWLQDISEADAISEGCTKNHNGYFWGAPHAVSGLKQMATAVSAYRDLWESINGTDSWAANPLVWVVEFKVVKS